MEKKKRGFIIMTDAEKHLLEKEEFYPASEIKKDLTTADEFIGYIINDGQITPCFKSKIISDKLDKMGLTK